MDARSRKFDRSGFTLIEMLVVIIILGILAMIIIPQITVSTEDAKLSTLQTSIRGMRSALELYYNQHTNSYPGASSSVTKPSGVSTLGDVFAAQLSRYTDEAGNISNTKDATFKFGPYMKDIPVNPFNKKSDVTIDSTVVDITTKSSSGAGTGWKFYVKTGVLMAADGAHDTE